MPELPEVQTTVDGLNAKVKGRKIVDVWTDYKSTHKMHAQSVKNPKYFAAFKKAVVGAKIKGARRRAKNILIDLSNGKTILIHMKMTGHLMYGKYSYDKKCNTWMTEEKGPLEDPFNQHIHLVFTLDKKHLVFSDLRKFAKVAVDNTSTIHDSSHLAQLGPEPLGESFSYQIFSSQIRKRPKGKIKQVLMDQAVIAGIGNIYSDEILWRSNVHPLSIVSKIPEKELKLMYKATIEMLKKGLKFGGDSTSDYRNIEGKHGAFQGRHSAYQRHKEKCTKPGCKGTLERIQTGGRSAHFCPVHQILYK